MAPVSEPETQPRELGTVARIWNPNTWGAEAGGLPHVPGQLRLHYELEANLD